MTLTPDQIAALPYRPNVGLMVINAQGLVWVGRRLDSSQNAWQMPQGGIDKGETPEQAALRELEEETGIVADDVEVIAQTADWVRYDLPPDLLGKLWKGKWRGQEQKWFLMRFTGSDDQITIETEHPEFGEWDWVAPDQLVDRIVPFKRAVYAQVLQELGPLIPQSSD